MDTARIDDWLDRYQSAWSTNDPSEIASLFTDDVRYYTAPFQEPIIGNEAVVSWWTDMDEAALPWTFEYDVVAREGDLYVVRGITRYPEGGAGANDAEVYYNLWLVTLSREGRASEFIEYWVLEE